MATSTTPVPIQEIQQEISPDLWRNTDYVDQLIGIGTSWDIVAKPFAFGSVQMMSYVTNGFFMTMNMVLILDNVEKCVHEFVEQKGQDHFTVHELVDYLNTNITFVQVQIVDSMEKAVYFILSGPLVTFIEGYDQALVIDTRVYPMRSITTPTTERVIRGPNDAFTETMLMNTSLIRRRIRDPRLRVELMQIGSISQTDVSLLYLDGIADSTLVDRIRLQMKSVQVESLIMAEQSLTEIMGKVRWNPYPIVRYTERPDVASVALLEGQIIIVVDTSPDVIILPVSFFQHMQHPQEFHSYPAMATYLRWVIMFGVFASIFLPGVFILLNQYPHWLPDELAFFKAERTDPLPLWAEILVAEVALDLLRLAVTNTPVALSNSVGIVAALLFGQFATKIELMQSEVLVYMGFVMIAERATSSFEIGSANQIARLFIMLCTAFLHVWGFAGSVLIWFIVMATTKSFGVPYLWPLIPFQWKNGLREILLRRPLQGGNNGRPRVLSKKGMR